MGNKQLVPRDRLVAPVLMGSTKSVNLALGKVKHLRVVPIRHNTKPLALRIWLVNAQTGQPT
ncbi:hypothetical protein [Alicyclobacillus hesperidum]|uniref:hypothetical protein n=1 Tax=Alicyclobacillus hesperidum TaxID=89784 RepID=UPI00115FE138|nr:hypothetical protein [Alicyclobacillus hesperidum]